MATDTVRETQRQVLALSTTARRATFIAMDDLTLRVSLARVERGKTYRNIDIKFVPGLDLYTVTIHFLQHDTFDGGVTRTFDGVYNDMLGEIVDGKGAWAR